MVDREASLEGTGPLPPGYWCRHAWKMREVATWEAPSVVWHGPTGNPRGSGRAGGVADGPVVLMTPGNAGRGKGPWFGSNMERKQGMTTDKDLTGSERVRKLQTMLHVRAKEEPERRFHALIDKVWREDFLSEAWRQVCRNGGAAGVDAESFTSIELYGVERWLGELARDLRDGTYVPQAVRQVLIPKKQSGKFRPLGIPCIRDRVAQTSAMLVLAPIFEADLQPEQYAYRPGRSANDAVKRVHGLLNRGHDEVVDGDLSNYFGENTACRAHEEHCPPRQRRAHARAHQGVAGNAGGGG